MIRWCLVVVLLATLGPGAFANEIEFGALGSPEPAAEATFQGLAQSGPWLMGGFGSWFVGTRELMGTGGAVVGVRPPGGLTVLAKAGLGGVMASQKGGATWELGAEASVAGPWGFVLVAQYLRTGTPGPRVTLDWAGRNWVFVGLCWRIPVEPRIDLPI